MLEVMSSIPIQACIFQFFTAQVALITAMNLIKIMRTDLTIECNVKC